VKETNLIKEFLQNYLWVEPKELFGMTKEDIAPYNNMPSGAVGSSLWLNSAQNRYDREKQRGQRGRRFESCLGQLNL